MKNTKVAFIAHPLNISTLSIISGWPKAILSSFGINRIRKYLEQKKPFVFNNMPNLQSKTGARIDLIGIACPLLPDQMVSLDKQLVLEKIIESARLAKRKGANIVVLGGFTSVVGNEGEDVAKAVDIAVTSGNTFTAGLAIDGVETAMKLIGLSRPEKCVVIGATGDIGGVCASYFAGRTDHLACVGRDEMKLRTLVNLLTTKYSSKFTWHKKVSEAIEGADVVISATSALTTIIDINALRPGTIVCDVALPANIAREVSRQRKDLLVFEGGLSKVPFTHDATDAKWRNLMPNNAIYGCLAEGLLLGFENKLENFSIGRGNITQEKIRSIMSVAQKHGFGLSEYFCGERFYSPIDLNFIKEATRKTRDNQLFQKAGNL